MKKWQKQSIALGPRILMVILIMGGLFYGILAMAERSPEPIRKGLEDYLTQTTGGTAEITSMVTSELVPNVIFKIQGVIVRDREDGKKLLGKADSAYIALPFYHLLFGIAQYQGFEIKGLEAATGTILPKKLTLDYAGISAPEGQTSPALVAEGTYNNLPLLVTVEMLRKKGSNPPLYYFSDAFTVTFKLGDLETRGIVIRNLTDLRLESGHIEMGDHVADFTLSGLNERPVNIKAKGKIDGVDFNADLTKSGEAVRLEITPVSADAQAIKRIKDFAEKIQKNFGLPEKDSGLIITVKE